MITIEGYGYSEFFRNQEEQLKSLYKDELIIGRVTEVHKEQYKIIKDQGESFAKLKGSLIYKAEENNSYPTVGDFVLVKDNPCGEDIIYEVFERKSKFSRFDTCNKIEQLVAANFDYVFIMTSLNHDFNLRRVERYLTATWQSGGTPVIVLTKRDMCDDYLSKEEEMRKIAKNVDIVSISSYTGEGIDELKKYIMEGKTIVFLGSSGVGKSSLVNVLMGSHHMEVKDIREDDSKGRHTTTHRELMKIKGGAMIIDTPGMRELSTWEGSQGLESAFKDIEDLSEKCRFRDCTHNMEPGCAVKLALETGELSEDRWISYLKLKKEVKFIEKKYASQRIKDKRKNRRKK